MLGFFTRAGFPAPELFVYIAAVTEAVSGLCLVLGLYTRFAAPAAAGVLIVATGTLYAGGGFKWLWNKGGFEYPIFWALVCLTLTVKAWMPYLKARFSGATA